MEKFRPEQPTVNYETFLTRKVKPAVSKKHCAIPFKELRVIYERAVSTNLLLRNHYIIIKEDSIIGYTNIYSEKIPR